MLPKSLHRARGAVAATLMLLVSACAPSQDDAGLPAMRWDHRPEAVRWTLSTMNEMEARGTTLTATVPTDIEAYCPGYEEADEETRAAFWSGLFSAIAKYESTWNPKAIGGGGLYRGLLQILPSTAKSVGCDPGKLLDGSVNLACAVRIADRRVKVSDGSVGSITADWGPMHWSDKRAEMASWTRQQNYCQPEPSGPLASLLKE
jgi:Transglycosylase SLT domain